VFFVNIVVQGLIFLRSVYREGAKSRPTETHHQNSKVGKQGLFFLKTSPTRAALTDHPAALEKTKSIWATLGPGQGEGRAQHFTVSFGAGKRELDRRWRLSQAFTARIEAVSSDYDRHDPMTGFAKRSLYLLLLDVWSYSVARKIDPFPSLVVAIERQDSVLRTTAALMILQISEGDRSLEERIISHYELPPTLVEEERSVMRRVRWERPSGHWSYGRPPPGAWYGWPPARGLGSGEGERRNNEIQPDQKDKEGSAERSQEAAIQPSGRFNLATISAYPSFLPTSPDTPIVIPGTAFNVLRVMDGAISWPHHWG
jgi:hypothetical protein